MNASKSRGTKIEPLHITNIQANMYMAKSVTKSVLQNVERSMTDEKSEGPKTLLEILCRESAPMLEKYALCRESRRHLHMGSHWKNPQAKFSGSAAVAVPGRVLASDMVRVLPASVLASETAKLICRCTFLVSGLDVGLF